MPFQATWGFVCVFTRVEMGIGLGSSTVPDESMRAPRTSLAKKEPEPHTTRKLVPLHAMETEESGLPKPGSTMPRPSRICPDGDTRAALVREGCLPVCDQATR